MSQKLQSKINSLINFNKILFQVDDPNTLEHFCSIFAEHIKETNFDQSEKILLDMVCSNIVAKISINAKESRISPSIKSLIELLVEKNLMPALFANSFQKRFNYLFKTGSNYKQEKKVDSKEFDGALNFTLDQLLKTGAKGQTKNTFGFCFVDIKGNFIWADANCERHFEMKKTEMDRRNFFDLMIPFSLSLLSKKYGPELFSQSKKIGTSLSFPFVMYSHKAKNKFIKILRKKGIMDTKEIKEDTEGKRDFTIFYRYMKALSCRATLVVLKYKKGDIDLIKKTDVVGNLDTKSTNLDSLYENIEDHLDKEKSRKEENGFCFKRAIMLEVRDSRNIPNFNYEEMKDDSVILSFERFVNGKIKNKYFKGA